MTETTKAETRKKLTDAMDAPGGKQAVRFLLSGLGGGIPYIGGLFSGGAALWSEREQNAINQLFGHWATLTDAQISDISGALAALTAVPTRASFAVLLGELFGDALAERLLTEAPSQIPVILSTNSVSELQP